MNSDNPADDAGNSPLDPNKTVDPDKTVSGKSGPENSETLHSSRSDAGPQKLDSSSISSAIIPGARFGNFQILRKLGRGGMATVYAARDLNLNRDVAMKVLQENLSKDTDYVKRFRREAHASAKLNHPNIVQVYEVGSVGASHYITQELVDGQNLRERLADSGQFSPEEAFEVMVSVATALEHAASFGITHRDIKPENIMRSAGGEFKVADFGLASVAADLDSSRANLTAAGLTLGTPRYMSPEQVQGLSVDVRSDLYSLGVSMYHLLAGRPPFEADDPLALAVMHLHETPQPLDRARDPSGRQKGDDKVPEWMVAVVAKLMNKQVDRRYQSPADLLSSLRDRAVISSTEGALVGGAAGLRIRLQRETDNVRGRRDRRHWRTAALVAAPILLVAATAGILVAQPETSVASILVSENVDKADSVQQQYLFANRRNDEAGWLAVEGHYPADENATNAAYAIKSKIQLARYFCNHGRWDDARKLTETLLADPKLKKLYRGVVLAQQCEIAKGVGDDVTLKQTRVLLHSQYSAMESQQPNAAKLLLSVISQQEANLLPVSDQTGDS